MQRVGLKGSAVDSGFVDLGLGRPWVSVSVPVFQAYVSFGLGVLSVGGQRLGEPRIGLGVP